MSIVASRRGRGMLLCGLVVVIAVAIAIVNSLWLHDINPWVLITGPFNHPHRTNSVIGYAWLLEGGPIHKENLSPMLQSLAFNGALAYPDGYYLRPFFPFVVSLGSWLLGVINAGLAVNYVSYAFLVVATGWLASRLRPEPRVFVCAAALAATGSGSIVHLNDISAHMLALAAYALIVCFIYASDVWRSRQPLAVHLQIATCLAIASLAYPSGFLLTVGYVAIAAWHSRLIHVAMAAAAGFLVRSLWEHVLNFGYRTFFGIGPFDLYLYDFGTAQSISMNFWLRLLRETPALVPEYLARPLIDSFFLTFPLVSVLGMLAVPFVNRRQLERLWFFGVFLALPYVSVVFFSPGATARGYLAYSSAFILFASLAVAVFEINWFRLRPTVPALTIGIVIALQAGWSVSYFFGYYFPAITFYLGPTFADPTRYVEAANLSGALPLWKFVGGSTDFVAAGGLPLGSVVKTVSGTRSFGFALLMNGFVMTFVVGCAALSLFNRKRIDAAASGSEASAQTTRPRSLVLLAAAIVVWGVSSLLIATAGYYLQYQTVQPFNSEQATQLTGERSITVQLKLSDETVRKIVRQVEADPDLELELLLRASGLVAARIELGGEVIQADPKTEYAAPNLWRLNAVAVARALAAGKVVLNVQATFRDGWIGGWQQAPMEGRQVTPQLTSGERAYFPGVELRLWDKKRKTTTFIGY
jgi:hypothetical protein